jgi:hypothetical protein
MRVGDGIELEWASMLAGPTAERLSAAFVAEDHGAAHALQVDRKEARRRLAVLGL